jgi:hypothetical protein
LAAAKAARRGVLGCDDGSADMMVARVQMRARDERGEEARRR